MSYPKRSPPKAGKKNIEKTEKREYFMKKSKRVMKEEQKKAMDHSDVWGGRGQDLE